MTLIWDFWKKNREFSSKYQPNGLFMFIRFWRKLPWYQQQLNYRFRTHRELPLQRRLIRTSWTIAQFIARVICIRQPNEPLNVISNKSRRREFSFHSKHHQFYYRTNHIIVDLKLFNFHIELIKKKTKWNYTIDNTRKFISTFAKIGLPNCCLWFGWSVSRFVLGSLLSMLCLMLSCSICVFGLNFFQNVCSMQVFPFMVLLPQFQPIKYSVFFWFLFNFILRMHFR